MSNPFRQQGLNESAASLPLAHSRPAPTRASGPGWAGLGRAGPLGLAFLDDVPAALQLLMYGPKKL